MRELASLAAVLALAVLLRVHLDWDGGYLLHPDERFLAMLAADARLPADLGEHLDPARTPLDPTDLGRDFFVYGTFPLLLVQLAGLAAGAETAADFARVGRGLSAAADVLAVLLVYAMARGLVRSRGVDPRAPALAALGYAGAVLAIQQAHFFTVDALAVCATTGALLGALRFAAGGPLAWAAGSGVALGLALACKVSSGLALPCIGALLLLDPRRPRRLPRPALDWRRGLPALAAVVVAAYAVLRVADPRFFASPAFWNPWPNPDWLADLARLRAASGPEGFYPPAIQWIDRTPGLHALANLVAVGLGPPLFALALMGIVRQTRGTPELQLCALWTVAGVVFYSTQFVHTLRYFGPFVPVLALFAGIEAARALAWLRDRRLGHALAGIGALVWLAWPIAFTRIYERPHTRVEASEWILEHVPPGSVIAVEHWDDPLPLPLGGRPPPYRFVELPVFEPDTAGKWQRIERALARADLLVLSSARGYGTIGRLPDRYPRAAAFYRELFAGERGFELAREFTSFPGLLGLELDDRWAEEAFSVYDHPVVRVYRRSARP